jgi:hypothetical protein
MDRGRQTGAPVLDTTEARQASRVGLIWVLAASLGPRATRGSRAV